MPRQPLNNGSWFNPETSEKFEENTFWDGRNHISRATESQWDHERLYRTKSKRWVLNTWSQMQGSRESWEEITNEEAAVWLVANDHDHPDVMKEINSLEI